MSKLERAETLHWLGPDINCGELCVSASRWHCLWSARETQTGNRSWKSRLGLQEFCVLSSLGRQK